MANLHPIAAPPPAPPLVGIDLRDRPAAGEVRAEAAGDPEEQRQSSFGLGPITSWFDSDPAWLASAILHLTVLILGALLAMGASDDDALSLTVGVAEDLGDQMIEQSLDLTAATELDVPEQLITPELLPKVDDPLAAPPEAPIDPAGIGMASDLPIVTPGAALSGRTPGQKQALLKALGGTEKTEAAVLEGLRWLKRQQRKDGGWSLIGPYSHGAPSDNREAATAMALLAFQGAGKLPTSPRDDFGREVRKGATWLLEQQNEDGSFFRRGGSNHRFYTEALCTIVLCELLAMTGDEQYREPATKAVNYLIATQSEQGGWKYRPSRESDLSVTGWVLMALKSGRMAGIQVPSPVFLRIEGFIDTVSRSDSMSSLDRGSRYVYEESDIFNREAIPAMTSVGLLCRQYLGWPRDERRLESGIDFLLTHKPEWRRGRTNLYYWYYATQVLLHAGGPSWPKWNRVMRELLPDHQVKKGPEKGSWDPREDRPWGASGGRLYSTCMGIYVLEVYYRHLPLYQQRAAH